jgi:hypothetical protein
MQSCGQDADYPIMRSRVLQRARHLFGTAGAFLLMAALADETIADADVATQVSASAECIEYSGLLTQEANERAFALFAAADHKPTKVCIDSKGGSAEAGMQLGAWILAHSLSVSIADLCLSSCANYVFPAGRIKILAPSATLMWHGGATQPISEAQLNRLLDATLAGMSDTERGQFMRHFSRAALLSDLERSLRNLIDREAEYFRMLGVDPRIATLGHIYESNVLAAGEYFIGWDYSLEDLVTLGVHDVVVDGDRAWTPRRKIGDQKIFRLDLKRLPGFEPLGARD